MKAEEILKKAIDKAEENGFDGDGYELSMPFNIIFQHDFAKAFWGTDHHSWYHGKCEDCSIFFNEIPNQFRGHCWQYYLQQMVLEEDPIKYLEKFL